MPRVLEEIKSLIKLGYEGEYWDYKEKWHKDKYKLVHDVLCFANTSHDKDCFIIVGVSDTGEIKGLEKDEMKKQADLIGLFSSLKFAGETPKLNLFSFIVDEKYIDVLVIKNSSAVPYFLNDRYHKVNKGLIYSREGDRNTPIVENSPLEIIESLWKKRFSIDKSGIEKFNILLDNRSEWVETDAGFYNQYSPEYTLEYGEFREGVPAFYSYTMDDESTHYQNINLKINGTVLNSFDTAILDGGRYTAVSPERDAINFNYSEKYCFRYYTKDSLVYKLNKFLYNENDDEEKIANSNLFEVVLLFESRVAKNAFVEYVKENQEIFDAKFSETSTHYFNSDNEGVRNLLITGMVLKEMQKSFIN
ncbi:Putative DNA-binding domain-containing protein [Bacillus pumilus]|uniref:ATP-binding protein n=1 Tax=Bacillus pumilus TaxID=1408 RepID=UPI003EFB46D6